MNTDGVSDRASPTVPQAPVGLRDLCSSVFICGSSFLVASSAARRMCVGGFCRARCNASARSRMWSATRPCWPAARRCARCRSISTTALVSTSNPVSVPRDVVGDDEVELLALQLAFGVADHVLGLGREAHHQSAVGAPAQLAEDVDRALELQSQRARLLLQLLRRRRGRPVVGDRGRHEQHGRRAELARPPRRASRPRVRHRHAAHAVRRRPGRSDRSPMSRRRRAARPPPPAHSPCDRSSDWR